MIDPKRLELAAYEGLPHLLHPVVVDPKEASQVLRWAVEEMESRYRIIGETGEKSIDKFNRFVEKKQQGRERIVEEGQAQLPMGDAAAEPKPLPARLPYIVIVIDELADLMMVAQRNVEESLTRLAQMARASGIHLILATQRPSVDVITGIIKANFPTRISFQVSSKVDSRTILDQLGAEQLLGQGDMLFMPPGTSKLQRIHGAFVSDREISRIVSFIRKQETPVYDESIQKFKAESPEGEKTDGDFDEKYDEAVELVTELGQASVSLVQRYLKVGYNRAARMIERMEKEGVVGPSDGVKPQEGPGQKAVAVSERKERLHPQPRLPEESRGQRGHLRPAVALRVAHHRPARSRRNHHRQHLRLHPARQGGIHRGDPPDGGLEEKRPLPTADRHGVPAPALRRRAGRRAAGGGPLSRNGRFPGHPHAPQAPRQRPEKAPLS